jgi:polyhydroxyalkanoate synthesis repressor PhaR
MFFAPVRNVALIAAMQHNDTAPAADVKRKIRTVMERKPVIIKKYENRRLYNTANSRYVNLDEVAQMVQEGHEVQVLDAASGEDITRLVLTQIIAEQAKTPGSAFPLDILRQMVAATSRASQETALNYMKAMFDLYQNAFRSMPSPMNPFALMPVPGMQRPAETEAASAPVPGNPAENADESNELRRRVADLESIVANLGSKKSARKKRAKPRRKV